MTNATFTYLNHRIEIRLPDPSDDNTIHCIIYRVLGTYDAVLYNAYFDDFQFSAAGDDPNTWVLEGVRSAKLSFAAT